MNDVLIAPRKTIVSVIIPTYNTIDKLIAMIDCMISQTLKEWELIIVDDGSIDGSFSHVQKAVNDIRVKFVTRDRGPKGSAVCRNIGFYLSQGEYILHLDADDLISMTCLEYRVKYMQNHIDLDFAIFKGKSFSCPKKMLDFSTFDTCWGMKKKDDIMDFLKGDYPFSVWNIIFRKKSIETFVWDEKVKIYTDFSFIMPLLFAGLKYEYAENADFDYFYRVDHNSNNMCANFVSEEKCLSTLYLFNKTLMTINIMEKKRKQNYKTAFLGLIELHFIRLILNSTVKEMDRFLNLVRLNYDSYIYCKFLLLGKLSLLSSRMKVKKMIVYILEILLFFKLDSIMYQIRKIKGNE